MADALKCRVMSDSNVELVEEVNETMGKLVASCTPIEDTIVHKFTHRIGDYVEIPHFGRGVITAQIVARDEESGANFEMYMTDVSDSEMISVEDITPRTEEATNA